MPIFPPCVGGARLGLGGAPLGNLFAPVADADAAATLAAAWDSGCRSFDTAPHYGHGLSEHRFGAALRVHPRSDFTLSSKVGRLLTPAASVPREQHLYVDGLPFVQRWDFSAAGVRRSVEDSLQRLGLARLDVAFVHDCDAATHGAAAAAVLRQVQRRNAAGLAQPAARGPGGRCRPGRQRCPGRARRAGPRRPRCAAAGRSLHAARPDAR